MSTPPPSLFPRGLAQPEGGFRFAMDSLLLAAWAGHGLRRGDRILDLGCGSGVIGLGMLLQDESATLIGLDADPAMLACARENTRRLGLESRGQFVEADVRDGRECLAAGSVNLVVCNPPWRAPGTGRPAASARQAARFYVDGVELLDFLRLAGHALVSRGRCCLVHRADALAELMTACVAAGLEPKRLRCLHPRAGRPARLILLEARKGSGRELLVEPPLVLYADAADAPVCESADGCAPLSASGRAPLSEDVLALCPWLACNAGNALS
ncbi:tRNA1(Val) (adenine(37)-N6)-methyltransferase [Megalodesulfovibrio paquesii]